MDVSLQQGDGRQVNRSSRIAAAIFGAALIGGLAGCSVYSDPDEILLKYKAGVGDDRVFEKCIQPGHSGGQPVDDQVFSLPTSLRTWNIRADGSGDSTQPIGSGSKPGPDNQPGPAVVVWTTADFYLNTDCGKDGKDPNSPIVQFWEQTGHRPWKDGHGVSEDGEDGFDIKAWRVMLLNTLVPAEEKAIREQTRFYTADELDANLGGVWGLMEAKLGPAFNTEVRAKVGGDYFCGAGFKRDKLTGDVETVTWTEQVVGDDGKVSEIQKSGKCPPIRISITGIDFANAEIAQARANVFKAEQDAKAALINAQKDADVAKIKASSAADPNYIRLRELEAQVALAEACARNANCTVIAGTNLGAININGAK